VQLSEWKWGDGKDACLVVVREGDELTNVYYEKWGRSTLEGFMYP